MNVLICDDIQAESKKIAELLSDSGFDINASIFHNGKAALAYVRSGALVDVCFLDIVMPEMDGIKLAATLREDGYAGEIVFLTFSKEFGYESYRVKAFDYLLKPPTLLSVREVLQGPANARSRKYSDTGGILINTKGSARFIMFHDISYEVC